MLEASTAASPTADAAPGCSVSGERALDAATGTFGPEVWKPGLGLFRGVWFGPHWDALDRYVPGLSGFIRGSVPPGELLVAIDEDTAMIGDGLGWEVIGARERPPVL